jgi:hypothetical protein
MESHRSWLGLGDETTDDALLAIPREEFEGEFIRDLFAVLGC